MSKRASYSHTIRDRNTGLQGPWLDVPLGGGAEAALDQLVQLGYERTLFLENLTKLALSFAAEDDRDNDGLFMPSKKGVRLLLRQAGGRDRPAWMLLRKTTDGWFLDSAFAHGQ
jgi:hypothetical protein